MDDLAIPQVPPAKDTDVEDVSWALSTAEAMWARGDHADGIKWVRKAAEAASEAEDDARALELAKAAADLAGLIARRSKVDDAAPAPAPPPPPESAPRVSPTSITKIVATPSRPPIALPSKSQPPRAMAPRPLASGGKPQAPKARRDDTVSGVADTAPRAAVDAETALAATMENPKQQEHDSLGQTVVANVKDIVAAQARREAEENDARESGEQSVQNKSADEWDRSPTANAHGNDPALPSQDRMTTVGAAPGHASVPQRERLSVPRTPSIVPHDSEIQTSQAVRVVVWRDASGVHVAPAGTVVSAITVDAVLVALHPDTDLTAWLSQRDR